MVEDRHQWQSETDVKALMAKAQNRTWRVDVTVEAWGQCQFAADAKDVTVGVLVPTTAP